MARRDSFLEVFKKDVAAIRRYDLEKTREYGMSPVFKHGLSDKQRFSDYATRWFVTRRSFDLREGAGGVGFMELQIGDDRLPGVYCSVGQIRPAQWRSGAFQIDCYEPP